MATKTRYKYIEEPDSKLKCAICEGVAKDPVQEGNCGKLFCGRCIKKRGETKPCLHCTKSPNYFKDTESHKDIQGIIVSCKNYKKGCTWTGTMATLEDHVTQSCDYTKVPCKYKAIGCTKKVAKKDAKEHEKKRTYIHLELLYDSMKKMEETIYVLKTMKKNAITFKLSDYRTKKEAHCTHVEVFCTSPGGHQMDLLVGCDGVEEGQGTHISVATSVVRSPPYCDSLKGRVQMELLNQLRDGNHYSKSIELYHVDELNAQIGTDFKFIRHSALAYNEESHTQYLANDTLYLRVTVAVDNHRPWLEHV